MRQRIVHGFEEAGLYNEIPIRNWTNVLQLPQLTQRKGNTRAYSGQARLLYTERALPAELNAYVLDSNCFAYTLPPFRHVSQALKSK